MDCKSSQKFGYFVLISEAAASLQEVFILDIDELIEFIEKRVQDINFMINSTDKDTKINFAREYGREELLFILNFIFQKNGS